MLLKKKRLVSVSKHIKILEEAGLVDFKKDGLWGNYYFFRYYYTENQGRRAIPLRT
jgi:DNA-binding transcriptional ArsR family regulator